VKNNNILIMGHLLDKNQSNEKKNERKIKIEVENHFTIN
jgi:hypothetical protein